MVYVSFLICMSLQNDIERVGYLKSLPLRPIAIVLGELLGFVGLLSVVQGSFFLALCGLLPSIAGWLVCAAALSLPLNFLLFGIDKLIFSLYPTRRMKGAPGDFQNAGRQMLFVFLKMLLLGGGLTLVGVAAIPGAMLQSPLLAVIPAVVVLLAECTGLIPLLTYALHRFDPSVDTPARWFWRARLRRAVNVPRRPQRLGGSLALPRNHSTKRALVILEANVILS